MVGVKAGVAAAIVLTAGLWAGGQYLANPGGASVPVAAERETTATVISGPARVVDGDTVRIGSTRIRIQGIDAPELQDRCLRRDGRKWDCGRWSAEVARARFEGRTLDCRDLGERSHDRVVAQCLDGPDDFAAVMLTKGAARACERYARQHPHSSVYMALEAAAASARRGIFDGTPPPRAGFCRVRGAPLAASKGVSSVPEASGACVIKGNINRSGERIFHLPGQAHYDRVVIRPELGQRWFCSEEEARAAGWRRSLR